MPNTGPASPSPEAHKPPEPYQPEMLHWSVTLQIGKNGCAKPQGDWRYEMKVGDKVRFLSPDGEVKVVFEPADDTYKPTTGGKALLPFGVEEIIGGEQVHVVQNSCKSIMKCYIKKGKKWIGYSETGTEVEYTGGTTGAAAAKGSNICTGGGDSPTKCP
jgi:hypothetical protein